jgi:hypothetical protein
MVAPVGLAPTYTGSKDQPITILAGGNKNGGYRGLRSLRLIRDRDVGYYYFIYPENGGSRGDCTLTGLTRTTLAKLHDKANIRLTSVCYCHCFSHLSVGLRDA